MNFAWPWCFLLFLPVAFAAWRMLRRARRGGVKFPAMQFIPAKSAGWRARAAALAPYIFLVALALLVTAAARPRTKYGRTSRSVDAIAIAMAVDVSGSMEVLDLTPREDWGRQWKTRLDVVKELFARFVEARPDDLISLVVFGGYASCRAPLTADHAALLNVLKGVQIPSIQYDSSGRAVDHEEQLTAIGDGIAVALARVKNAPVKSKVIILLSDGVQTIHDAVDPAEAAKAAAALGVKVYAIGVGTKSDHAPMWQTDAFGRKSITTINMSFDESQLKGIAQATGAKYFAVNDEQGLAAALEEIDQLEKTTVESISYERYTEHFAAFLVSGAILALAAITLQMAASRRIA
ncbi:MAG: VWA domain-containing protein [Kiritimatiellae bacterium]|nr:VWA domain-containing protein [Kiritimatiellia bacterium]